MHAHNLEFRNVSQYHEFATNLRPVDMVAQTSTYMGYCRANGCVGTRNYIAVLTSVDCSATAARMIVAHFTPASMAGFLNVDGVVAFVHETGCGVAGAGDGFEAMLPVANEARREPCLASEPMVALQCGGSDAWPGITANHAPGYAFDFPVA